MKKLSHVDAIMMEILRDAEAANYPENRPTRWKEYNFDRERGVRYMANVTAAVRMFQPLPKELSAAEIGMLLGCLRYLETESNMLYYRSDRVHKAMSVTKLAEKLGKSTGHIYRFITKLCKLRVLAREQGRLYVNPCYFFRGRFLSYHLYRLFKPELSAVLPVWVVERYEGNIHA